MTPRIFYLLHVLAYLAMATCLAVGITRPVFLLPVIPLFILAEYFYFLYDHKS